MSPFDPAFEDLPEKIPIFPLGEVLLLPRGRLPLNIFEPRYLAMVDDALSGNRMIGMVQPSAPAPQGDEPEIYQTGCAGRICRFEETPDGRYLIALNGVCRFDVAAELPRKALYRAARADWSNYAADLDDDAGNGDFDRDRLLSGLQHYFRQQEIEVDWDALKQAPDERLVTCLAMVCPFCAAEKQALLEAPDLAARAEVLTALVEMAALGETGESGEQTCQ